MRIFGNIRQIYLKYKPIVLSQFIFSFLVVFLCTLIFNITSYRALSDKMLDWIIENNNRVLSNLYETIGSVIVSDAQKQYVKYRSDAMNNSYLDYYAFKPLIQNTLDVYRVQSYMKSVKNINDIVSGAAVFYVENNLVISDSVIYTDTYYSPRIEELKPYLDIVSYVSNYRHKNRFFAFSDGQALLMVRPVVSNHKVSYLFMISYDIGLLSDFLSNQISAENVNLIITDENGQAIFDLKGTYSGADMNAYPGFAPSFLENEGHYRAALENMNAVISHQTNAVNGWKYIFVSPMDSYMDSVFKIITDSAAKSVLFTLCLAFIAVMGLSVWQYKPFYSVVNFFVSVNRKKTGTERAGSISELLTGAKKEFERNEYKVNQTVTYYRENFAMWFLTEVPESADEIDKYRSMLNIEYAYSRFRVVSARCAPDGDSLALRQSLLNFQLRLREVFNASGSVGTFIRQGDIILGLINYQPEVFDFDGACLNLTLKHAGRFYIASGRENNEDGLPAAASDINPVSRALDCVYLYPEINYITRDFYDSLTNTAAPETDEAIGEIIYNLKSRLNVKAVSQINDLIPAMQNKRYGPGLAREVMQKLGREIDNTPGLNTGKKHELTNAIKNLNIFEMSEKIAGYISDNYAGADDGRRLISPAEELVRKTKDYIGKNLTSPQLGLSAAAESLNVTPPYLSRIFSGQTGKTFVEYVTDCKMEYARALLKGGTHGVSETARFIGYSQTSYFIKKYKERYGVTPSRDYAGK